MPVRLWGHVAFPDHGPRTTDHRRPDAASGLSALVGQGRWLSILLLAFLILGGVYSALTPLYEAPDEVWHDAYVRWLAAGHGLPPLGEDLSGAYQEAAQPPLYYLTAAAVRRFFPDADLEMLMWHNPGFGYQAGGTVNDNKNMLIHTARERFPWRGAALAVHITRLVSLLFGAATVVVTWGVAREALNRPWAALLAAALVAFTPQFLFISGVVSNDSAAAALSTAALWSLARVLRRGATLRRILVAGGLAGLAALTKSSALLLLPLGLLALAFARGNGGTCPSLLKRGGWMAALALAAGVIAGWWYVRNAVLYGDPLGLGAHIGTPWGRAAPASFATLLAELPKVYRSFWGAFGWGHVEYPPWVYLALGLIPLTGLVGWLLAWRRKCVVGHGPVLLLTGGWGALVFGALLQWMRQVEAPHGRLLFPAVGAAAVLVIGGWEQMRRPWVFLPALALLSLITPWWIIRPAFAPPRLMEPAAAAATVQPVGFTYDGSARLLGVSLDRESAAPGEWLTVRACWEGMRGMSQDYTVFVHLVGWEEARVAERYTYPGLGRFPTSLWPVGQAFCDAYRLRVEEWAPVPERYDLLVGLYDAATGARLPVRDAAGGEVNYPVVAQVRVAPAQPLTVTPTHRLDYRLGDGIALLGYDLAGGLQAGGPLTVTLYWRAERPLGADFTAFVHLLGEDGQPLAQHDGPPRWGRYPTSIWQPGDVVPDEHALVVPALPSTEGLRLVAGMYDPATMERLSVVGPGGPAADNLVVLSLP
jgi:hypothetical protein